MLKIKLLDDRIKNQPKENICPPLFYGKHSNKKTMESECKYIQSGTLSYISIQVWIR